MHLIRCVLKIAQIIPVYKTNDDILLSKYRPISVLPFFPKLLERIMYNTMYNYILECNLYEKQSGFQAKHSTGYAIIELTNLFIIPFNENKFTNLPFKWFESYLIPNKQFIKYLDM